MLTRTKLRALSPGQWARVRVPEYKCWQKPGEWTGPLVGKELDICVIRPTRTIAAISSPTTISSSWMSIRSSNSRAR
jgi:hypothetical protein